jgi:uncharacterized damage-inducible protein DinB
MKKRSVGRTRIGEIPILLHLLDEGYGSPAWHGPSLKTALRGLTARQAAWRPAPGRHNIRELAMHAAYWKWVVRRRLTGEKGGSFPIKGNNWLELPASSEEAWHAEREILEKAHQRLRETVARFSAARLTTVLAGTRRRTALREIAGIALHDVYHTGQIQLLKALRKKQ